MKLRFKLMIIIVFLSIFFLFFTIILILGQQFATSFVFNSERLSITTFDETSQHKLRATRLYYGLANRPLVNSIYAIQKMMLSSQTNPNMDPHLTLSKAERKMHFHWIYLNTTRIQDLEKPQYSRLIKMAQWVEPIGIMIYDNHLDHFSLVCEDGFSLHFSLGHDNAQWHNSLLTGCEQPTNCSSYVKSVSSIIISPTLDLENEIWSLRADECVIIGKKGRKLALDFLSDNMIVSFYSQGKLYLVTQKGVEETDFETALSLWPNQTDQLIEELYKDGLLDLRDRPYKMYYHGMDEERVLLFSSYFFVDEFGPKARAEFTIEEFKSASLLYLQSMTLRHYESQGGRNSAGHSFNLELLLYACLLFLLNILYIWRKAVVIALSIEVPIKSIIKLIKVDMKYLETSNFSHDSYQDLFNNEEIYKLYKVLINYLNNIKYSNNKLLQGSVDEAEALIILSMSKQFYKKYNNMAAVGICANNIAKIHMKNQRYLEAMNEQEESLLIANQDLQSLKQMENIAFQAMEQNDEQQLYELYLRVKNKVLQKFIRQEDSIMVNLEKKAKILQSGSSQGLQRKNTMQKSKQPSQHEVNVNINVKMSVDSEMPRLTSPRPHNWSRAPINEVVSEQQSDQLGNSNNSQGSDKSKREEFMKQQLIIEHKIVFRKYCLAGIVFNYSIQKSQSTFLNESVMLFNQIIDDLQTLPETYSTAYLRVNILTKKAFCYAKAGMLKKAQSELREAIEKYEALKNHRSIKQLSIGEFIDIFREIPLEILHEKIAGIEALLMMLQADLLNASLKFVELLRVVGPYDPGYHKFILQCLARIFNHCKLKKDCLIDFQQQSETKRLELIFLLDYSGEMTAEQFTLSHSMCKYVIQQISDDAYIGLYAFNDSMHEIFPLQLKKTYRGLIEKSIDQLLLIPGGTGNIFNAIEIAIAFLFDQNKNFYAKQLARHIRCSKVKDLFFETNEQRFSIPEANTKPLSSPRYSKANIENFTQALNMHVPFESESMNDNVKQFTVDIENMEAQFDDQTTKYICIFSEGVHNFNSNSIERLQSLIKKTNVHLLIFNIANQNMNMLYLKQLAEVSPESQFFTNETEMIEFFEKLKINSFNKRIYLEFF